MNRNDVIMQYFQWYLPDDGMLWQHLAEDAPHLSDIGITMVWMPPAFKATGTNDVGYGVYDLFDLGEFDQKGSVRTKYGTKDEYLQAIQSLRDHHIRPIADIVLNHKANGDEKERFRVLKMNPMQRQESISDPYEIESYTMFNFPGRQGQYSDFVWHWYHFSGVDYDALHDDVGVFMILGEHKGWADNETVDSELGNYDYLMFNDIDYDHPEVRTQIRKWLEWYIETTGIDGFRMDAVKHIDYRYLNQFIHELTEIVGADKIYAFAEYWNTDYQTKENYLAEMEFQLDLVDVKLHMNFFAAGSMGEEFDLRTLFDGTLMAEQPMNAVTFVDNHDTQPGQSLVSTVADWFKPIAYGVILLHQSGLPTVFYGDYYGIEAYDDQYNQASFQPDIDALLQVRKQFAYGDQFDYLDDPHCIGWTRQGDLDHPGGVAVIMTNSEATHKRMQLINAVEGASYYDALGNCEGTVTMEAEGWANFPVSGGTISAWVPVE